MKKAFTRLLSLCVVGLFSMGIVHADEPTLNDQLRATAEAAKAQMPADATASMEKAIQSLRDSGIAEHALKKGETMPDFTLPGIDGKPASSKALRKKGPLVVVFYRGAWCPFCNLQLHDLQKHLAEFKAAGATLVAISPQTPDGSASMAQKQSLEFPVLSDKGSKTAQAFGVAYTLPPDLVQTYKGFGLDLEKVNGTPDWQLPLATTYVVTRKGKVAYAFVDVDYRKRAETSEVIDALKAASH